MTTDEIKAIRRRAGILGIRSPGAAELSIDAGTLLTEVDRLQGIIANQRVDSVRLVKDIEQLTASLADCRACRERLIAERALAEIERLAAELHNLTLERNTLRSHADQLCRERNAAEDGRDTLKLELIEAGRALIKRSNASMGWWNDPYVYECVKKIEAATGHRFGD